MSATKPPSPQDIPILRDVVVPGQRAARGQMRHGNRRASDLMELDSDPESALELETELEREPYLGSEPEAELRPEPDPEDVDDSALYESLLGPGINTLDIDGAIDRVLDKHAETLRVELRREFQRLLEQARKNR